MLDHRPSGFALERREGEHGAVIVLEEELEQTAAQPADSVVEDEVSAFRSRRELARVNQSCSNNTAFSRLRVQQVFEEAVVGSSDAPKPPLSEALGRFLYPVHLAVLLWWLLDKSSNQRATASLVSLTQQLLPSAALTLRVPSVRRFVISAVDGLVREALLAVAQSPPEGFIGSS